MNLNYRKCTVGRAMRNQMGYRQKHYIPMVMIGRYSMPLSTQFDTATRANEFSGRFARKWNRAEDLRIAAMMEAKNEKGQGDQDRSGSDAGEDAAVGGAGKPVRSAWAGLAEHAGSELQEAVEVLEGMRNEQA